MVNRPSRPGSTRGSGKAPKSGFKYKERTAEDVKKRAEQTGGRFDSIFKSGVDTYRPKVGDNLIRILPPTWDNHEHYGYDVWVHKYIGPDNSTYLCPAKMLNKRCPVCAAAKEAETAGEKDEAKALGVSKQTAVYILDRDEDDMVPKVYVLSWTMDRDIAALCHNKRTGKVLLIDHPDEGYDVTIKRAGQGLKTKYFGIAVDRDPSPISDDEKEQDAILEQIEERPIPSLLNFYDSDYLDKVLSGTAEPKDEELDETEETEDRPARGSRRSRDEEEVEEEETPRSRRSTRRDADEETEADEPERSATRRKHDNADDVDEETGELTSRRTRRGREEPADEEDDPPPARTRRRAPVEEEEEDPPARTRRRAAADEETEEEEPAPRGRRAARDEEVEEEDPPARRSRRSAEEEPDDPPPRRRGRAPADEEEEEEPAPRTRRGPPPRTSRGH